MSQQNFSFTHTFLHARPSRLFISSGLGCLLLAVIRFWLLPGSETGTAHLMMLWLVRGAGIMAAWGLLYEVIHRWGNLRSFCWAELHFWGSLISLTLVVGSLYIQDSQWTQWLYLSLPELARSVMEEGLMHMKWVTVMGLVSLSLWQIWGVLRTLIAWLEAKAHVFFEG